MKTIKTAILGMMLVGPFQVGVGAKGNAVSGAFLSYKTKSEIAVQRELLKKTLDLKLAVSGERDTSRPAGKQHDFTASATLSYRFGI